MSKIRVDQIETLDGQNTKNVGSLIDDVNQAPVTTDTGTQTLSEAINSRVIIDRLPINVLDFGAVGDGVTDDTAAVQAAVDSSTGRPVYFPAGEYLFTSPIAWGNKDLTVFGDNCQVSRLVWDGPSIGFDIGTVNDPVDVVYIRGLAFLTKDTLSSGAAISGYFTDNYRPTPVVEDCFFSGYDRYNTWWWEGISFFNAMQPIVSRCEFLGANPNGTVAGNNQSNAAIHFNADTQAVIPKVDECHTLFWNYAVFLEAGSDPSIEGASITGCDFVYCNVGVRANFTNGNYRPPQLFISGTHCEAFQRAVSITNVLEVNITQCLFYSYNENFSDALIWLENVDKGLVTNSTLIGRPNSSNCRGVLMSNCRNIVVTDNILNTPSTHIGFINGTTACKEYNNTFLGTGDRTGDTGSGNIAGWTRNGTNLSFFEPSSGILTQAGTLGTTTNGSGDITITFERPFPNGVITVIAVNGDTSAEASPIIGVRNPTTTNFVISTGEANSSQRVNWVAYGY